MRPSRDIFWIDDNFHLFCRALAMDLQVVWKRVKEDRLDLTAFNADRQHIYIHVQLSDTGNDDWREVLSIAGGYEKVIWIFRSMRMELRREIENYSRSDSPANVYGYEMREGETCGFDFQPVWEPHRPAGSAVSQACG